MAVPRLPMAEFLVQRGYVTPDQLDEATKVSTQTSTELGRTIINLGFAGEREVLHAQAQEVGHPFVDLDRVTVEPSAVNIVPERIAKMHSVMPVSGDVNVAVCQNQ